MTTGLLVAVLAGLAAALAGGALALLSRGAGGEREAVLVDSVNRLLPGIQCAQCGHPGCRPYAEAIVREAAPIDRCPPGGDDTVAALADLLGRPEQRVDPAREGTASDTLARIDETRCIGCALCLPACPVDAIVGAPRFLHTVLERDCTGCALCIAPCPVDCIALVRRPPALDTWRWPKPSSRA